MSESNERTGPATTASVEELADIGSEHDRPDPVEILERQAVDRLPQLVPVRYGRMLASPFTFYRGAAAVMASDLGRTRSSGLTVQLCGDAHLSNFGLFGSPERRLMFDVNDFDETYPGPFEWDVKRLVASLVVAGRANGFDGKRQRRITHAAGLRYRQAMAKFAGQGNLSVWYAGFDVDLARGLATSVLSPKQQRRLDRATTKARSRDSVQAFDRLTVIVDGVPRLRADPPLVVTIDQLATAQERDQVMKELTDVMNGYGRTLSDDLRHLLDQFELVDAAQKVVGVGSVGTRCWIALLLGVEQRDPLFLQVKEAQPSVLAAHLHGVSSSRYANQGKRVVAGQRLMQAASDIFLGWRSVVGFDQVRRDYYVRQLRDWKGSVVIEKQRPDALSAYGEVCAWTLARAHARSGPRHQIAAYLGDGEAFADAMDAYATQYADRTERDHAALANAAAAGRVTAEMGV